MDKVVDISKYDTNKLIESITFYLKVGDIDKGVEIMDRVVSLKPLVPVVWEQKIAVLFEIIKYYYNNKDADNAKIYIEKALKVPLEIEIVNKSNLDPFKLSKNSINMMNTIDLINENVKKDVFEDID